MSLPKQGVGRMFYGLFKNILGLCRFSLLLQTFGQKVISFHVVRMLSDKLFEAVYSLVIIMIGQQNFTAAQPCPGKFSLRQNVVVDFCGMGQVTKAKVEVTKSFH